MTTTLTSQAATPLGGHSRGYIESVLAQLDRLPSLSPVAARILSLTTAPDSSVRELAEVIQTDASLASAVLRLVNRADRGAPRDVTTIDRAVTLLGFQTIRQLALTVKIYQAFADPRADAMVLERRRGMWVHNLAVACASELLAERMPGTDGQAAGGARSQGGDSNSTGQEAGRTDGGPTGALASSTERRASSHFASGEAFVCGLLHDIGKIALDACFPKSYARVIERVEQGRMDVSQAEREVFGLDHTIAGKRIVRQWQMPPCVADCAWLHHQSQDALPSSVSSASLIALVHLADSLVRRHNIGFSGTSTITNTSASAALLGISEAALGEVVRQVPKRMAPLVEAVGLGDGTGAVSTEALLTANHQLGELCAALTERNQWLELRSRAFDAVALFMRGVSLRSGMSDVCAHAAQTLLGVFAARASMIMAVDRADGCVYVGNAGEGEAGPSSSILEHARHEEEARLLADGIPRHSFDLITPPPAFERLWQRFHSVSDRCPVWLLPLPAPEGPAGCALISVEPGELQPWRSALDDIAVLASAIGRELTGTRARVGAERMAEELVDLNRRVRDAQAERLRTRSVSMIAEMADGAAHELNNPLSVISGRAQLAMAAAQDPEIKRSLEIIQEQTTRAANIALDLMAFAKPDPPKPVQAFLRDVLEPLCQHWQERFSLTPDRLTVTLAHPEAVVFVDLAHLGEILTALVSNAAESGERESIRVEVNSPSRPSDEAVRIVVRDNGAGMSGEVLDHAIDPFFSHRPAGRGRGLGLSKAYRLTEINGGKLWLESTPDVGTTVTIELPPRAQTDSGYQARSGVING